MIVVRSAVRAWIVATALFLCAGIAGATTLIRAGLDDLVSRNDTIVVGEVVDAVSYWNGDHSFILTDVIVQPIEVLKGNAETEIVVTLMGGTVDDLTSLIVGGAELVPERSYVLFLGRADLPGSPGTITVLDHCQGVFEVLATRQGDLRAVSQANRHPLVPDRLGHFDAPGGVDGFPFAAMVEGLRDTVARLESGEEESR